MQTAAVAREEDPERADGRPLAQTHVGREIQVSVNAKTRAATDRNVIRFAGARRKTR